MLVSVESCPMASGLKVSCLQSRFKGLARRAGPVAMELDEEVVPARQIEARVQHGLIGRAGKSRESGLGLRTNQFRQPDGAGLSVS